MGKRVRVKVAVTLPKSPFASASAEMAALYLESESVFDVVTSLTSLSRVGACVLSRLPASWNVGCQCAALVRL